MKTTVVKTATGNKRPYLAESKANSSLIVLFVDKDLALIIEGGGSLRIQGGLETCQEDLFKPICGRVTLEF